MTRDEYRRLRRAVMDWLHDHEGWALLYACYLTVMIFVAIGSNRHWIGAALEFAAFAAAPFVFVAVVCMVNWPIMRLRTRAARKQGRRDRMNAEIARAEAELDLGSRRYP